MSNLFKEGGYFPPLEHQQRIERYRKNKHIYNGNHALVFNDRDVPEEMQHAVYIASNLAGIVVKKSADLLFGENPVFSAGKELDSPEQKAIERLIEDNDLHTTNYESALGNGYRGDSFYKVRWGQKYGGLLPATTDPYKVFIEAQQAEYVFPETLPQDNNTIFAYHIAIPTVVEDTGDQNWILNVESHYPSKIEYSKYTISPFNYCLYENVVTEWRIVEKIPLENNVVLTGVNEPLIVHTPNYSIDDSWHGIDDISENESLFAEINNRLSKIAEILDKHSDPMMAVGEGILNEDERGNLTFNASIDKVFEIKKDSVVPQYIVWDGQLQAAFKELEVLTQHLLAITELPPVALGMGDAGTSGNSGLAIKWRMNSLLSKINRKRQYYNKSLKQALFIAQKLEHAQSNKSLGYEITVPKIKFKDGLPEDAMEQSTIANMRTGGKATQSQLTAIMELNDCTEEQARIELARIKEEEKEDNFVESTVFNNVGDE